MEKSLDSESLERKMAKWPTYQKKTARKLFQANLAELESWSNLHRKLVLALFEGEEIPSEIIGQLKTLQRIHYIANRSWFGKVYDYFRPPKLDNSFTEMSIDFKNFEKHPKPESLAEELHTLNYSLKLPESDDVEKETLLEHKESQSENNNLKEKKLN